MTAVTTRAFCRLCDPDHPEAEHHEVPVDRLSISCLEPHACGLKCSLDVGHAGPHEAMTSSVRVIARWAA